MNDLQVIFDVGAKNSTYPIDYPDAVCHLFEPNKEHFQALIKKYHNRSVPINPFGLGDKKEVLGYDPYTESFISGTYRDYPVLVDTLDSYIEKYPVTRIDLLKIDAEGMDYKVLLGGSKAIAMARYIIFEHWDNLGDFETLLSSQFYMVDIGERNILCKRRN